eukprot:EG_transcript_3357
MVQYAGSNNEYLGLSGYLLVAAPYFLQRLEGPDGHLNALVNGIKKDKRHKDFVVVEKKPITNRTYGNWTMRSFNLVKSSGTDFEAVSFILRCLSRALFLAAKVIHSPIMDALMAGQAYTPQDEPIDMIVVTIALGWTVVCYNSDQKTVADVPFLCNMVKLLRHELCGLNPSGRGLITTYGGNVIQVAIQRAHTTVYNLENKVVRACVGLATGQGHQLCGNVRVFVNAGPVEVRYLSLNDDLRKGRFLFGPALTEGRQAAKQLLEGNDRVVLTDDVARRLIPEFPLSGLGGGRHVVIAKVLITAAALARGALGPGRTVTSCEGAVTSLVNNLEHEDPLELREILTKKEDPELESCASSIFEDEADFEWIYRMKNTSKALAHVARNKKRRMASPRGKSHTTERRLSLSSVNSLATHPLLTLIYISTLAEDCPMSNEELQQLGQKASDANKKIGVSGFLLYTKPYFLQFLEGAPGDVKGLFGRICLDRRHTNLRVLALRVVPSDTRAFGEWSMRTTDFDAQSAQEMQPMREVLHLLSQQYHELHAWMPRLQNDLLLSGIQISPGAYTQCSLVAFAVLPPAPRSVAGTATEVLRSLVGFLARGGELVGFLGDHLVGYAFEVNLDVLLDEVADLCADYDMHAGIATGSMMLVNAGTTEEDSDFGFYGLLFERAQALATAAAQQRVAIVAEKACEMPTRNVRWASEGDLSIGTMHF